jgi:hypothetical protein
MGSVSQTFGNVYTRQAQAKRERAQKVRSCLSKLENARVAAEAMQSEVQRKEVMLGQAQFRASSLLKDITESTMRAETKKGEVLHAKNLLTEQQAIVQQERQEYQRDLATAAPALHQVLFACLVCVPCLQRTLIAVINSL